MSGYSYVPLRLGAPANYSKLVHRIAGSHHLKLYGQDQKTRDKYLDHLKAQSMASVDGKKGTVAPQVYPKGWPVKNSTEFVQLEDVAGMSDQDYTNLTHRMLADFHHQRSKVLHEAAWRHSDAMFKAATESNTTDDMAKKPEMNPARLPSLFDSFPEPVNHSMEAAQDYHSTCHGAALMEAAFYRGLGDKINDDISKLDTDDEPNRIRLNENMAVCKEMYNMTVRLAELHSLFGNAINDYQQKRADATFNRDQDGINVDPPQHTPDPNPFPDNNPIGKMQ